MDKEKVREAVEDFSKYTSGTGKTMHDLAQLYLDGKLCEVMSEEEIKKMILDNCIYLNKEKTDYEIDIKKLAHALSNKIGKVGLGREKIKNIIRFHIEAIGATYGKDSLEPIIETIATTLEGEGV